jgi:5-methyltetrahydrofolate--homocysteine methyltransferase
MNEIGSDFLQILENRILVLDGAMGTSIHALDLPLSDYRDLENCYRDPLETRPDAIEQIHRSFLEIGCRRRRDRTRSAPTASCWPSSTSRIKTYELNVKAAQIARRAVQAYSTTDRRGS